MIKKRKILFVLPSLKAGGAERVLSFLAKNISKKLFTVKLVVLGYKKDSCYNVDGVDVIYLNRPRLLMAVLPLFRFIRIHKPHIVFSSMGHVNMVLSLFSFFLPNITFVGREASVISKMNEYTERKNKFLFFQKTLYKRLDKIVCQSTDMKNDLIAVFNINPEKLIIINNPITEIVKLKKFKKKSSFKFITIGRLSMEKGYLRILNALSKIESYDFNYTIIGSGYLEKQIKVRVENLGLGNKNYYEVIKTDKKASFDFLDVTSSPNWQTKPLIFDDFYSYDRGKTQVL